MVRLRSGYVKCFPTLNGWKRAYSSASRPPRRVTVQPRACTEQLRQAGAICIHHVDARGIPASVLVTQLYALGKGDPGAVRRPRRLPGAVGGTCPTGPTPPIAALPLRTGRPTPTPFTRKHRGAP